MKLSVFLLLCSIGLAQATDSYAQKATVNLEMRNQTVKEVLDEIEEQSDFSFFFNIKHVDLHRRVSVVAKKSDIFKVLETVFAGTDVSYSVVDKKIILSTKKQVDQQNKAERKITGIVKDGMGIPIIGANILVRGTTIGTISDIEGNFTLEVPEKAVLTVSYIGYLTKEIKLENEKVINIILTEDTHNLEEVVVVGFGTQKKVNLTGAVSMIDSKVLENRPVQNVSQALQGVVPGLQISSNTGSMDQTANIQIRGTATINEGSSGSPLILIDGMEGDIKSINPQDIENISVLKDAASASIYGSRAPFGVILITTKSGRTGKPVINYNNNFRWNDPISMPNPMDSYTFATFFNDAAINAGQTPYFSSERLQRIKDFQSGVLEDPVIVAENGQYWADGYSGGNANVDWYDVIYRDWTFSQEHNLSINGGTEKVNYYMSMNYLDQNGLMEFNQDKYKRYTATAKVNVNLTNWAKLNYSSRFSREDYGRPTNMSFVLYRDLGRQSWPVLPLYDSNGYLYSSPSWALGLKDGGRNKTQTDHLYQQAALILEPIKNWTTHLNFNYRTKSAENHEDKLYVYNHDIYGNPYPFRPESYVSENLTKENYMNISAYSEYSHVLNESHNLKGMIGFQCERLALTKFGLKRNGVIISDLPEVDLTTGLDSDGNLVIPSVNGSRARWSTAGFFGRINYDYQGKYLAEVNLRYDGTSRFRVNQRWNWFPSFSIGWNLAREKFWSPFADYVNTLKLRTSYGVLGNQNTNTWYPTYQVLDVRSNGGNWIQNNVRPNIVYTPALISSTLGWERVKDWNIGLDFAAFNNRLTGSIEYFQRKTVDMVGPAPELPVILGIAVPQTNNTDLKTYGMDLNISWNDRLQNGLGYSIGIILSDAQTKITRYPNSTGTLDKYIESRKMGEIWGYETIGIAKNQSEMDLHLESLPNGGQNALGTNWSAGDIMYRDLNNDGKIDNGGNKIGDHGDLKVIGNNTPRYQFGLDLTADWKGFDLRAFFQGVMKCDYWQGSPYFFGVGNSGLWHSVGFTEHVDYFRLESSNELSANIDAYYPRPIFDSNKNNRKQTRYLQNAAYIRLKNIQLGYTLPVSLTNKLGVSKLRLYLSGENLWTGTSLAKMFDPETIGGGWDGEDGIAGNIKNNGNGNTYPLSKTVSVGISVTL